MPDPLGDTARLAEARALALVSRPNDDPDRIGASSIYHQRRTDGRWFPVDETVSMSMVPRIPREERDPARAEGIRRSPFTLADADGAIDQAPTRLAATMDLPGNPDHALYDGNSEKLARAATVLARQNDLERIDHVVLSIDSGRGVRTGENLFVVQGRLDDPAHARAVRKTNEALARTPARNEQLLAEAREQALARVAAQAQERAQTTTRESATRALG